ncbi:MAG TPA: cation diffusion facilitator family transporter [Ktedonobacterales bacterium]|nr:cation diffusion facilitator family transporter [Ktedonobacterales bacterium]
MANPKSQRDTTSREDPRAATRRPDSETSGALPGQISAAERFAKAVWGPLLGLAVNLVLVVVKAFAGVISGSAALLADAGHSGADVANNALVLASLIYSRRPADESHPYGHDRAEVLAAIASSFLLAGAALFFGWDSIQKLIIGTPAPTSLALYVAMGTLVVKLIVVRVEGRIARNITSQAVAADARDSLADVLSSIAVILGVIGARLGHPRLDGAAGIAIALLILFTAISIGGAASHELLEHNIDPELVEQVRAAALAVPGVREVVSVTGRGHGSDILVEMSIQVDPAMTVARAADLANETRQAVYTAVPRVGDVMVEFNTDHLARLWARFR